MSNTEETRTEFHQLMDEVRGDLELIWVTQAEEALKAALPSAPN